MAIGSCEIDRGLLATRSSQAGEAVRVDGVDQPRRSRVTLISRYQSSLNSPRPASRLMSGRIGIGSQCIEDGRTMRWPTRLLRSSIVYFLTSVKTTFLLMRLGFVYRAHNLAIAFSIPEDHRQRGGRPEESEETGRMGKRSYDILVRAAR